LFGDGKTIADDIRKTVREELGLTVSVGVSFNKVFAKLGSDIKKPDATTIITKDNFHNVVWPLPAADLLGVGRATQVKFLRYGIRTIGDIAKTEPQILQNMFGKWGLFLYTYANGLDTSPVKPISHEAAVKSVGNSTTCPRDLENEQDAHIVFLNLAESVAERMRELGLQAKTVQISLRTNDLVWCERQMTLPKPSMISTELAGAATKLLRKHYSWEKPLRSIGIRGTNLIPIAGIRQLSFWDDEAKRERLEQLEYAIDGIRRRFGHRSINRALLAIDSKLGKLDAKADHIIHPVGYM
jgi:DNA polymerase-4